MPKTGVYSEVEDPNTGKADREKHFMDPYLLPDFPKIRLKNPTSVLQESMENVRRERTVYRAKYIPIDELYSKVISI
jgi:arylsulfatase A-like enzyme